MGLVPQDRGPEYLAQGDCGTNQGGTSMSNLSPEIERKLRNLDLEDMKKVTGFFCLVEEGDKQTTEIWSMANNKGIEPEQVADFIYEYMDLIYDHILHQNKTQPEVELNSIMTVRYKLDCLRQKEYVLRFSVAAASMYARKPQIRPLSAIRASLPGESSSYRSR